MNFENLPKKIDSLARFFLYVLIFWIPFGNAVIESCVGAVFFLWFLKRLLLIPFGTFEDLSFKERIQHFLNGFKVKESFLNFPIAVFLYICLLSALWSRAPLYSLHGFISKILEWFVVYFLVLEFFTEKKHVVTALVVFLFSATSVCADSLTQFYITGKSFFCNSKFSGRASSCFYTGNGLGGYLLFVLSLSAGFFFTERRNKAKTLSFGFIFLLALWALATTLSRGAWIAGILGTFIFLFFRKRFFSFLFMLSLILIFVNIFIILPSDIKQKIRISPAEVSATVDWRRGLWEDSFKMIKDKPLLGHGPNTFMQTFREEQYRRRFMGRAEYDPSYAHNCYIQMAAEVGLLGLGCFLWILGRFFKNIGSVVLNNRIRECSSLKMVLLGLWVGAFSFCLHSFVDTHFYSLKLSILFWTMTGISVAIYKLLSQEQNCAIKEP